MALSDLAKKFLIHIERHTYRMHEYMLRVHISSVKAGIVLP
jgi:hypothetical protein